MPVTSYSTTAANNNSAAPNGAPEGMSPSSVNDTIRQIMADVAKEAQINNVKVLKTVAGTDTITADMDPELDAYVAGMMVAFTPAATNTGAVTINIDGLGALDIQKEDGDALAAGDLVIGIPALLLLDSGADDFILLNPQPYRCSFSAHRATSQQALPSATLTTLIFNTEAFDVGTAYDTATGVFTAPRAGYYQFNATLTIQNQASGNAALNDVYISKNNDSLSNVALSRMLPGYTRSSTINASSNAFTVGGSVVFQLAASDTVRLKVDLGVVGGVGDFTMNLYSHFSGSFLFPS